MSAIGDRLRAARTGLGMSQAQLARDWGVSPRMIRKIERGETPGDTYATAISQLDRGNISPPARRRTKTGALAHVRGKPGQPAVRPVEHAPRGRGPSTTYDAGGRRAVRIATGRTTPQHAAANVRILDELRIAARGSRAKRKGKATGRRVAFFVEWIRPPSRTPEIWTLGKRAGLNPSDALRAIRGYRGNAIKWLTDQMEGIGYDVDDGRMRAVTIAQV